MKQSIVPFFQTQRQKQIVTTQTLIVYSNQSIMQLWQKILKYQAEGLGWTIYLVIQQNINILKYKSLSSCNDINLPKELNHS